ncbi:MAG: hypothetical protein ABL994_18655, partial [Verrucomicrobiales bacterium]
MSLKKRISALSDSLLSKPGKKWLSEDAMGTLGIRNIKRFAKIYNRWRFSERAVEHQKAFNEELEALLSENSGLSPYPPKLTMKDGWAIDTSGS